MRSSASFPVGVGGYVVRVQREGAGPAVLKVSPTGGEQDRANRFEALMLGRYAGQGAVLLFDADSAAGALLVERCVPGTTLDTLGDAGMVRTGCWLARTLHRAAMPADVDGIPIAREDVASRARRFDEVQVALGDALSARAWGAVRRAHDALLASPSHTVICHGDLNPGNILSARRLPWLAIDPLPTIADAAYDAASLVWAQRPWLLAQARPRDVLARRIALAADGLETTPSRVWAWTLVRLVEILLDRRGWGGFDERPLIQVVELLAGA